MTEPRSWIWKNFHIPCDDVMYDNLNPLFVDDDKPILCYIPPGVNLLLYDILGRDDELETKLLSKLSTQQLNSFSNKEIDVYFYEPVCYRFIEELIPAKIEEGYPTTCRFHMYEEFDVETTCDNMTIIEFDYLQTVAEKYNFKFKVYTCDYNLSVVFEKYYKHLYPNIICLCYDIFIRETAWSSRGQQEGYNLYPKNHIVKLTNKISNLNLRYATHRQIIAAHCATTDCRLTWNYLIDENLSIKDFLWVDHNLLDWNYYDNISRTKLAENLNFLTFKRKPLPLLITDHRHPNVFQRHDINNNILIRIIHECFLYVCTESRFCQPTANISEKVFKGYLAKRPMVLAAPPYSLECLHKLGFKSFSDWWDESYDKEENHTKRLKMIFDIIDYVNSLPYEKLHSLLKEMHDIFEHNFNLLKDFESDKIILP